MKVDLCFTCNAQTIATERIGEDWLLISIAGGPTILLDVETSRLLSDALKAALSEK